MPRISSSAVSNQLYAPGSIVRVTCVAEGEGVKPKTVTGLYSVLQCPPYVGEPVQGFDLVQNKLFALTVAPILDDRDVVGGLIVEKFSPPVCLTTVAPSQVYLTISIDPILPRYQFCCKVVSFVGDVKSMSRMGYSTTCEVGYEFTFDLLVLPVYRDSEVIYGSPDWVP